MVKKYFKKAYKLALYGASTLPLVTLAAGAAPGAGGLPGGVPGPLITQRGDIENIVNNIVNFLAGLLFIVGAGMLIWSAILYMTAGGSEDRVGKAKSYLIYAIVGILVGVLTLSIKPFIETFFATQFG